MTLACFHCQQPVLDDRFRLTINGKQEPMCCPGCHAAASSIINSGLGDFYQYQQQAQLSGNDEFCPVELDVDDSLKAQLKLYDRDDVQSSFVFEQDQQKEGSFIISGISCSACTWLIEKRLSQFEHVIDVQMNLSTHRLWLKWQGDGSLSELMLAVSKLGYQIKPFVANEVQKSLEKQKKQFLTRIGIATIAMVQVMMNATAIYIGDDMEWQYENLIRWASLFFTTPVVFYSALPFFTGAWRDFKSKRLGMDVPVALAVGGAYIASVWATVMQTGEVYYESVTMFTFFLLVGRYLEYRARLKFGDSGNELLDVLPTSADKLINDEVHTVLAKDLNTDDHIRILAGQIIAADGIVISGQSKVDEASISGESTLLEKSEGSQVHAGAINVTSSLHVKVTAAGLNTNISNMARLLARSQDFKPKIAEMADKLASQFVWLTLLLTLATGIVWYFIDPTRAFWVALSVLVITCPCALSLATPTALTAATTALRRAGLLISRNQALLALSDIKEVAFDKTGTLTLGKPALSKLMNHTELSDKTIINLAASLEKHSEHPIAKALLNENTDTLKTVKHFQNHQSQGVSGFIADEQLNDVEYKLGQAAFSLPDKANSQNNTRVLLVKNKTLLAEFEFSDIARPTAAHSIELLHQQKIDTRILSGDPSENAPVLAQQLNIKQTEHGLTAEQKQRSLRALQQTHAVAVVGDGINDALMLSEAQVSIAMASGTDLAKQQADVLLLNDHLELIPKAITLSKRVKANINQNFAWSLIYNFGAVPIAMMGWIAPWQAAIGMSLSSLFVVLNALRVAKVK